MEGAKRLEVIKANVVASEEKLRVQQHGCVAGRQYETVSSDPCRIGRIMADVLLEK